MYHCTGVNVRKSMVMMTAIVLLTVMRPLMAATAQAEDYPIYAPVRLPTGELSSMGSDTLIYLMSFWVFAGILAGLIAIPRSKSAKMAL